MGGMRTPNVSRNPLRPTGVTNTARLFFCLSTTEIEASICKRRCGSASRAAISAMSGGHLRTRLYPPRLTCLGGFRHRERSTLLDTMRARIAYYRREPLDARQDYATGICRPPSEARAPKSALLGGRVA